MSKSALHLVKDFMPVVLGLLTIAAVLIGTGRVLQRIDDLATRMDRIENKVFGFNE
jgi:hypothetical protein